MVFSTIKFYGVPAGPPPPSRPQGLSGEGGQCQVLRTLSCYYHQTVMAFCPILPHVHPPPNPRDDRTAPQQLHVLQLLSIYSTFHSLRGFSPPGPSLAFMKWTPPCSAKTRRTHFANAEARKLKWRGVGFIFFLLGKGRRWRRPVAARRIRHCAQTWTRSTLYPSQAKMQAPARRSSPPRARKMYREPEFLTETTRREASLQAPSAVTNRRQQ